MYAVENDVIIIDAPCSAVGTIRRNPEIFFKNKGPDFNELLSLQENMLKKASFFWPILASLTIFFEI